MFNYSKNFSFCTNLVSRACSQARFFSMKKIRKVDLYMFKFKYILFILMESKINLKFSRIDDYYGNNIFKIIAKIKRNKTNSSSSISNYKEYYKEFEDYTTNIISENNDLKSNILIVTKSINIDKNSIEKICINNTSVANVIIYNFYS